MQNKGNKDLREQMELLNLTVPMLLEKINIIAKRLTEENDKIYQKDKKKKKLSLDTNKIFTVSRATLYNVINKEGHTVSNKTKQLISMAINETREARNLQPIRLNIKTYNRWEKDNKSIIIEGK